MQGLSTSFSTPAKKWTRVIDFEMSIGSNQLHFSIILKFLSTHIIFDMVRLSKKGRGTQFRQRLEPPPFEEKPLAVALIARSYESLDSLQKILFIPGAFRHQIENWKLWKSWGLDPNQIRGCKAMMKTHKKCGVGNVPFGLFYLGALLRVFGTSLKVQWMINPEKKRV